MFDFIAYKVKDVQMLQQFKVKVIYKFSCTINFRMGRMMMRSRAGPWGMQTAQWNGASPRHEPKKKI